MGRGIGRIMLAVGAGVAAVMFWVTLADSAEPDGSDVAQSLGGADALVDQLTGSVGPSGAYGKQANAAVVPFLGADPTQNLPGVFGALDKLSDLGASTWNDGDKASVIATRVEAVDGTMPLVELGTPALTCGAAPCAPDSTVAQVTAIAFSVSAHDKKDGEIGFGKLPLPSISFLPKDAELDVVLDWAVNLNVVAELNKPVRIEGADGPDLLLDASVTLPVDPDEPGLSVDLGVLKVEAKAVDPPGFRGKITAELAGAGAAPTFGFDAGVSAIWHLATTEDSPLEGVSGDLKINWPLTGGDISPDGLTITLENMKINTARLVGEQLSEVTSALREITSPLRKATSPFMEPIPGLSDASAALGGDPVSILRIAETTAGFNPDIRKALEKLIVIDDALRLLGGGEVTLAPITLTGGTALQPKGLPANLQQLTTLVGEQCPVCADGLKALTDKVNPGGGGFQFKFPVLDNPGTLAELLLGRDIDLFTFDTGPIGGPTFVKIPIVNVIIFSVSISGTVEASLQLKGGFDTKGIRAAMEGDSADAIMHGLFLQNPDGNKPVAKLYSDVGLTVGAFADIFTISGGPKADVVLRVPPDAPDGKLRPFALGGKFGCELLKADDAKANIGVHITATIDIPLVPTYTETLASHQFLTEQDLCTTEAAADVANRVGGSIRIRNGDQRGLKTGEPDRIKVFARHGADGKPVSVTVMANDNKFEDFPVLDANGQPILLVEYTAANNSSRPVHFQAVATDGKPFEFPAVVQTANGDDDILLDVRPDISSIVRALGGNDKVIGGAAQDNFHGGPGNDWLSGEAGIDLLYGEDGNDSLEGGPGTDQLEGGPGTDRLTDSSAAPDGDKNGFIGGPGDDTLLSGRGSDVLIGDEGGILDPPDAPGVGDGVDLILTGGGADKVVAGGGNDVVRTAPDGGAGPDESQVIVRGNGGDDTIETGAGPDIINGGPGKDTIRSGGGGDTVSGGDEIDKIHGDAGDDTLDGNDGNDEMHGGANVDTMHGNAGGDFMYGDGEGDFMYGDAGVDAMHGGEGGDVMEGNAEGDTMHGDGGGDAMSGNDGSDDMFGDAGNDQMAGNLAIDTMHGGGETDCMYGNEAADVMNGDDGDDRMAGGSPVAAVPDDADSMQGNGGADTMAGDNADVCDGLVVLFDVAFLDSPPPPDGASGADAMDGGDGGDTMYGQGKSELPITGGDGADYIEGDTGSDTIEGGTGDDDLVGGSGYDTGGANGAIRELKNVDDESVSAGANVPPVGDTIKGGDGTDHIAGDNARLSRSPRTLVLYDVDFAGDSVEVDARASGNDVIDGDGGPDVIYGQGDRDLIHGNDGDDYAEGNAAIDSVAGDGGQDDLVGGSGHDDGGPGGSRRALNLAIDDADVILGGPDHDYLLGDNGNVTRPGTKLVANGAWVRDVTLYDVELVDGPAVSPDAHGGEILIIGDDGDDTVFGQGDNDLIEPAQGDDTAEGNHGSDVIRGGPGQDDLTGGGSARDGVIDADRVGDGLLDGADEIYGETDTSEGTADGNGADVIIGDNGRVTRDVTAAGLVVIDPGTGDIKRSILLCDLEDVTKPPIDPRVHGDETLWGNDNDDIMRGQGGMDRLHGGAGDDDIEGNPGLDRLYGEAGQDDLIGGSRAANRRDTGDFLYGGPGADYQLGDNGTLTRSVLADGYQRFVEANSATIVRVAVRFDVGGSTLASGDDWIEGNDGDDYQWGQDGNDELHGNNDNDDMFGELGNDRMFGEAGQDAMLGDRGGVVDRLIDGSPGDPASFTLSINPPPRITYVAFRNGMLDRRFDLLHDSDAPGTGFQAALMAGPGLNAGGNDFMRGGPGHDSMHGGAGDDLMNGDSAGDILFGDNGSDVMWGGRGCDPAAGDACGAEGLAYRGATDEYVDYLFGGRGGSATNDAGLITGGADVLDYRPRPGVDPSSWFDITDTGSGDPDPHQHHQGIDWMYGGWDRDVMQGDITANGPNDGDKMMDWVGAYNLYTHCNAAYGGFNDVREHSPALQDYLHKLSYALGAGPTLSDVTTSGRSGFNELAFVYNTDAKDNSGKAYPTTPGHFESIACAP
ncbi:MAG: hypothetical protein QOG87_3200 [Actinomycetota bacterium]|jgi:Ca2+-binding RTX toxin-like protein